MAPPVYSVGQVVGAADVNSWFLPLAAYKAGITNRSNTTSRTADPDLALAIPAGTVYAITCYLSYSTGATSGIGLAFGFTSWSGVSGHWGAAYRVSGDAASASNAGNSGTPDFLWTDFAGSGGQWGAAATPGDSKYHAVLIQGTFINGGAAGTLSVNWAQDSSNATNLGLSAGCNLIARRIN